MFKKKTICNVKADFRQIRLNIDLGLRYRRTKFNLVVLLLNFGALEFRRGIPKKFLAPVHLPIGGSIKSVTSCKIRHNLHDIQPIYSNTKKKALREHFYGLRL